jgi:hypothetical protein
MGAQNKTDHWSDCERTLLVRLAVMQGFEAHIVGGYFEFSST